MDLTRRSPPPPLPPPLVSVHERRMGQQLTASHLPSNRSSRGEVRKKPKNVMEAEWDLESQEGHKAKAKAKAKAAKEALAMRSRDRMMKPRKEDITQLADERLSSSSGDEHRGKM